MASDIHFKRAGTGEPIVLLHGLFGAAGNLGAQARALQVSFTVYSLDLPGHGRSAWLPAMDLPRMADSVGRWMDQQGLARAHLLGHSLGGKVAMQLALQDSARVASLVVADIAPVPYSARHHAIFAALAAVAAQHCRSRDEAAACLAQFLDEANVIQFLLASLWRDEEGTYRWRFDLQGLRDAYAALLAAPEGSHAYDGPVLFIKGGTSDYIREQDWPRVLDRFPRAELESMPDCGHWLHVEDAQVFNTIVLRFLASLEARKLAVE